MTVDIRVLDDPGRAAAELLAEAAGAGGHIVLSGGGSVRGPYRLAAELRRDWSGVDLWLGDERAVLPDDELSNQRLVRESLLDHLAVQPRVVHEVHTEFGAEAAASRYHRELEGVSLALALNGIGPDGHTASLFPNGPELEEHERRAVATEATMEPLVERVSLTIPCFAGVAVLAYLVTGESKAEAVRRAFAEPPSPATPASLVRGRRTIALLDPAAASLLSG